MNFIIFFYIFLALYGALFVPSGFVNHWPNKEELAVGNFEKETITTSDFVNAELDYFTDTETPRFCDYVVGSTSQGVTFCTDGIQVIHLDLILQYVQV
jgi:hypothetical protein